jgi:uncharacterized membrane protein YesL
MKKQKEIQDSLIYTLANYIIWFFLGNLYFILFNIPLIFLILGLATGILVNPSIWFTALCCIPLAPSLSALMGVMQEIILEKDVSLTKRFIKTYKNSFKQSIIIGTAIVTVITLLYFDAQYFLIHKNSLAYLFYFIIFYVFLLGLYSLSIISGFNLKTKDIIKTSFNYSLTFFKSTIFNILTLLALAYIFLIFTSYSILIISSILCYAIMYNNRAMLNDIKKRIG